MPPVVQIREAPEVSDANRFLHEAPDSLQRLFDALYTCPRGQGVKDPSMTVYVFLRSWLAQHIHAPQRFQYRIVEINGHWRHWYDEIMGAWRDRILPLEQVIFDVVHPDPPRAAANHQFLFKIILSQGLPGHPTGLDS